MGYVVACLRDRDFYQIPLALHEAGLLDRLITDCYYPDSATLQRLPGVSRIRHRRAPGLPSRLTRGSPAAVALQVVEKFAPFKLRPAFQQGYCAALANAALKESRRNKSHMLLYSEHAWEAFSSKDSDHLKKGLFVFHPHPKLIRSILQVDYRDYPQCEWSIANEAETGGLNFRCEKIHEECCRADFILCASTFTARSLVDAGIPDSKVNVVPYGIKVPAQTSGQKLRTFADECRFLFVGQGVQRKGLHHLFEAWERAALPKAHLTVVATRLDPGIARMAGKNVTILSKRPSEELRQLFASGHVFVMPSLLEGFGLVFNEALAAGCYCIGSSNTGLPDLRCPSYAAAIVEPGNVEQLTESIRSAHRMHREGGIDADAIIEFARERPWSEFRRSVADIAARQLSSSGLSSGASVTWNSLEPSAFNLVTPSKITGDSASRCS